MSAPLATANVIESWKLIPHSAWWAARSVSGASVAYGRILNSMPAWSYQPFARATKKPVWSVFGVQSSARRTVARGPVGRLGDATSAGGDGDTAAADGLADSDDDDPVGADEPPASLAQPANKATTRTADANFTTDIDFTTAHFCSKRKHRPGYRDGGSESMGLLPSLVRARSGSAGLWSGHTLSASALPGGDLQLRRS